MLNLRFPSNFSTFAKAAIGTTALIVIILAAYVWLALTRLPPRTILGDVPVGLLTPQAAVDHFSKNTYPLPTVVQFVIDVPGATVSAELPVAELALHQDPAAALEKNWSQTLSPLAKLQRFTNALFQPPQFEVVVTYDLKAAQSAVDQLAALTNRPGREPSATLKTSGVASSLAIDAGELGLELDSTASAQTITAEVQRKASSITLPVRQTGRVLTPEEQTAYQERAGQLVGKRLVATAERLELNLNDQAIIALIDPPDRWDKTALTELVHGWQKQTGTQPQEPEFEYDQTTLKVTKFTPPRNGRTIQVEETTRTLLEGFETLLTDPNTKVVTKDLPLAETPPAKPLATLNSLGINERIGFGESKYAHSIPNRIHNVAITTERINNVIIPPGAEFSFNKTLGEVSAKTGYRSAYVIKNGKTELGDGGGVCQVSTTVFRSVLNAGLQVTKRLPHSYRVSYYELDRKPGADATVYAGDVDLRFKNDTPNHILMHAVADSKNTYMYVELYGTSDGRRTEIVEHKTWDARPAPAPQYFPDPSLPPGKLVQIDWSAPGIRASLTNVIYDKNGQEIRRDTYTSNYKPWSAKYLQGVDPNAIPTP